MSSLLRAKTIALLTSDRTIIGQWCKLKGRWLRNIKLEVVLTLPDRYEPVAWCENCALITQLNGSPVYQCSHLGDECEGIYHEEEFQ